jgi:hypothetical protein
MIRQLLSRDITSIRQQQDRIMDRILHTHSSLENGTLLRQAHLTILVLTKAGLRCPLVTKAHPIVNGTVLSIYLVTSHRKCNAAGP